MKVDTDKMLGLMKVQIKDFLDRSGRNAAQFEVEIDAFLGKISGDIETAIVAGDERSLKYLRDRMTGQLARTSLKVVHQQRTVVMEIVLAVVRTAIQLAIPT